MAAPVHIAVLEESDDNRALIVELLRSDGFEVVAFPQMDDFLAQGDGAPRLAVADAWTAWRRENELCAFVPTRRLLVMTTADVHAGVWRALGAARIVRKPFFTRDFLRTVRELTLEACGT
jgi:CheY-like chemotaxis protein